MRWRRVRYVVASLCAGLILASLTPSAAAQQVSGRPLVIGGQSSSIEQVPWQALVLPGPNALCGGALIAPAWVVTAGHCVQGVDPATIQVFAGISAISQRSPESALPVAQVYLHPGFNSTTYANDVALLRLAQPWTASPARQAILLPLGQESAFPAAGSAASVSGWGQTSTQGTNADQLQSAAVNVLAEATGACGQYGAQYDGAAHICAGVIGGQVDTCNGDSGGPLVVNVNGVRILAGLTSVGNGCAEANYPGLYTRLATVLPWIDQIADLPTGPPAPPISVTARPLAGGRAAVSWQPVPTGGGSATFTASSTPAGAGCSTVENWCVISGLKPGSAAVFTVQAADVVGTSAASVPSTPIIAVHRTKRVGSTMLASTVRSIAKSSSPRVRSLTNSTCVVAKGGVRFTQAGLCTLVVGRSRVYVAVS